MRKVRKSAFERVVSKLDLSKEEKAMILQHICKEGLEVVKEMASEKRITIRIMAQLRRMKREKKIEAELIEKAERETIKVRGKITQGQKKAPR
jgi:hypothetical protein